MTAKICNFPLHLIHTLQNPVASHFQILPSHSPPCPIPQILAIPFLNTSHMERFSHRESTLLGFDHQRSSTNPSTPVRKSEVDFKDVFGGPPRRSSAQEMREGRIVEEEGGGEWCAWHKIGERPVFGDVILSRRRHTGDHFYDDIFGGDDSPCGTPLKHERLPSSTTMSPVPPLPPPPPSASSIPSSFRFHLLWLPSIFRYNLLSSIRLYI